MNRLTFFVFSLIVLSGPLSLAQSTKSDRELAGLVGQVKTIQSKTVDYTGDKILGEGFGVKDGDLVTYDEAGRELIRNQVSDFGEAMGRVSRTFDNAGLLVEDRWLSPDTTLLERNVYSYVNGRLAEILTYNGAGKLIEKTARAYDSGGRIQEESYFDPNRSRAKTVFKYDAKNNLVETAFFLTDGREAIAPVGPCLGAHRVTFSHDDSGRVIGKRLFEASGNEKRNYRWTYDGRGRIVSYISESPSSTVTFLYRYELDSVGNWIKRIATGTSLEKGLTVFGEKPTPYVRTTVETRQISYF